MILRKKVNEMAMTFNEKFSKSIKNLSDIDLPDSSKEDTNIFADFVELLTAFSSEDGVSYGDIQDRFFGEPDESNSPENNDVNESFIDRIFDLIEERITQYGTSYPFSLKDGQIFVLNKNLSTSQKLYIFLLMSSSLDIFNAFNSELTTDFETLSLKTMQSFLPNAIIKPFGKNSEYKGTAIEKIRDLAQDLGLSIKEYELNQIGDRNVQERGLDIVGWLPFADNCQNKIVFLCQCACGKNFESKQHDTHRFENYYDFYKTMPQHTMFIPYSLINPKDRKFYHSDYIERGCLMFERLRILNLTANSTGILDELKSRKLLEKVITR